MKIVLAPDSFKGSLSSKEVCDAMEQGIRRIVPDAQIVKVPMADGGEGTVESLVDATGGHLVQHSVRNPLGEPVKAMYGILGNGTTAVIEMAEASGLFRIPEKRRNPLLTSTYGTGELIRHALDHGCRNFVVGIGGSATNDGGAGMIQALGAKLLDANGHELSAGGGSLALLHRIELSGMDERLKRCFFEVACDVDNPLTGPSGASHVYGPQKGATPDMVERLDRNLAHFAALIREDFGIDVENMPGAGAAGGLGAGMAAFLQAALRSGVEIVMEASSLKHKMAGADLVFTGEGRCDFQTARGKTPYGVARTAQQLGIPVILVAGSVGEGIEIMYRHGVKSVFSIMDGPMTVEHSMTQARKLTANTLERIMRLLVAR
jgi:glycerate kinase